MVSQVCLQRAGQILWLPDFWQHATVNIGDTVAMGQQLGVKSVRRVQAIDELTQHTPRVSTALHAHPHSYRAHHTHPHDPHHPLYLQPLTPPPDPQL